MLRVSKIARLFKDAAIKLGKKDPLILASSTAFFTTFSIPPTLIILMNVLSLYFKRESLSVQFDKQISEIFGAEAGTQLQTIATNLSEMTGKGWITIAGSVFLIFVATNLFKVIKTSVNQIWNIRPKNTKKLLHNVKNRAIALAIVFLTGIFFLLSILADSLVTLLQNYLHNSLPVGETLLIIGLSKLLSLVFITLWFISIFRYLPDARIQWKAVSIGALVTAFLFMIGKLALERFLVNSNISNVFETSASIVLVLLFIFYSSLIMYYGAAFTFVLSEELNQPVTPRKYAEEYKITPIKKDGA